MLQSHCDLITIAFSEDVRTLQTHMIAKCEIVNSTQRQDLKSFLFRFISFYLFELGFLSKIILLEQVLY